MRPRQWRASRATRSGHEVGAIDPMVVVWLFLFVNFFILLYVTLCSEY